MTNNNEANYEQAIVAAGCFWGVEYLFQKLNGVIKTDVGYIGGTTTNPTYQTICQGTTGHREAVRIVYNPEVIDYEHILQYFFEIHDFTQSDGQGNDRGEQYTSAIFTINEIQKKVATNLIQELHHQGYAVATHLHPMATFWPAEQYHQNYYIKTKGQPYCHTWRQIF